HHDSLRAPGMGAGAPAEEGLPDDAVTSAERKSHAVVRRHEEDARRAGRSSHNDVVATESVVAVEAVASTSSGVRGRGCSDCENADDHDEKVLHLSAAHPPSRRVEDDSTQSYSRAV